MSEVWITAKGVRKGKAWARRFEMRVPLHLATGQLEKLSDLQVREAIRDLQAEQERRGLAAQRDEVGGWNPYDALRR